MSKLFSLLIFFVFIKTNTNAFTSDFVYPKLKRCVLDENADMGNPLFLTPLIESGKIDEARKKSIVEHKEIGSVSSYAGYLTVNKEYDSNLFFWFFPAKHNPKDAPVVLWLEGGPGATTLFGLFILHGPFLVTSNITLAPRNYSWTISHNLIYIDSPVGTGYSFTKNDEGYARDETQIGKEINTALVQFFQLFPELQNNDFFVTGESYAGKYVPAVSHAIKDYNINAKVKINLKGLAIGNGYIDPENQLVYGDYLYQIGLIDLNLKNLFHQYETKARDLIKQKKYVDALESINVLFSGDPSILTNATGFQYYFNYLRTEDTNETLWVSEWAQRADVRRAIHVGNCTFNFTSEIVENYLKTDIMQSVAVLVSDLLQHYKVLIYNGQLDIIVAYPYVLNFLQNLKWPGAEKYKTVDRKQWWVEDELAGYTKSVDNLTEVLVRNAGHLVPYDQPRWTLDLITRFTRNRQF
ncbi:PREDICTED: venom serine carboxypeptidase [Polistes canadensis]|uniref:venom serine carboxypeptidase n=1 Tax=Polistes canadensis TaxID=91411 RepID=UPI000718B20B|nr:PREDICTED: venom serine carboxypeptidase [Polistes canadensis]